MPGTHCLIYFTSLQLKLKADGFLVKSVYIHFQRIYAIFMKLNKFDNLNSIKICIFYLFTL